MPDIMGRRNKLNPNGTYFKAHTGRSSPKFSDCIVEPDRSNSCLLATRLFIPRKIISDSVGVVFVEQSPPQRIEGEDEPLAVRAPFVLEL